MALDESDRQVKRKLDDDKVKTEWFTEYLENNLKWSLAYTREIREQGRFSYTQIRLLYTKQFGKALVIDGKMLCAEMDEFIYHECLIHPALLCHSHPKSVFIMGGGDGYAAREVLKHKSLERVVLCEIEQDVVAFCRKYLEENKEAFDHQKLHISNNDIWGELKERTDQKFDIIVGDLGDPVKGGPCYESYTKSFYEEILKPKLNERGIFVTQAGPAGIFTHKEVFTSIHNTIKQVFKHVKAYTAHVPSFADTWGWVMASDHHPLSVEDGEMDKRIEERIDGELRYVNEA